MNVREEYCAAASMADARRLDAEAAALIEQGYRMKQLQIEGNYWDGFRVTANRVPPSLWQRIRSWVRAYLKWCWPND